MSNKHDQSFHEPLLSMESREEAHQAYPYLTPAKAASDELKKRLIMDEIAWHEQEIEKLKAMTDEPPITPPF